MPYDLDALRAGCARVHELITTQPAYARTSHLLVEVGGRVLVDTHYRGPEVADVFSVTKSVLATLVGVAVREGRVPDLDVPVGDLLGLPLPGQTLRHLLTMTRGCATDGPFDIDAVMALPTCSAPPSSGWSARRSRLTRTARCSPRSGSPAGTGRTVLTAAAAAQDR